MLVWNNESEALAKASKIGQIALLLEDGLDFKDIAEALELSRIEVQNLAVNYLAVELYDPDTVRADY